MGKKRSCPLNDCFKWPHVVPFPEDGTNENGSIVEYEPKGKENEIFGLFYYDGKYVGFIGVEDTIDIMCEARIKQSIHASYGILGQFNEDGILVDEGESRNGGSNE